MNNLLKAGVAGVGVIGAGLLGYVRFVEPNRPVLERITLPIDGLPAHLNGMTIALLSDFHYHNGERHTFFQRVIEQTNALQPDLIALTGDYVAYYPWDVFPLAEELAKLRTRFGVFAVLGNHDGHAVRWTKREITAYGIRHAGIHLLENESVTLDGIAIAGVESIFYGRPNLPLAMLNVPADMPTILLAHEPDFADYAVEDVRVKLQLSGHTHGGQVLLPGIKPVYLPFFGRKYLSGHYPIDGRMHLYVSRGIGVSHTGRVRFRCPPEITLITLNQ